VIEFDASEVERLADDLNEAGPRAVERAKLAISKTGHDTVADAQNLVPVDTGNLKNSIGVDIDPDGLGFEAGPTANYGHYVEYGTSRMSPQPYMMPAFDRRLPPAYEAFGQIVGGILRP
jgi:HK97 gp10 family phage protein